MEDNRVVYDERLAGVDVEKQTVWKTKQDQSTGCQRRVLWDDSTEGGEEEEE